MTDDVTDVLAVVCAVIDELERIASLIERSAPQQAEQLCNAGEQIAQAVLSTLSQWPS